MEQGFYTAFIIQIFILFFSQLLLLLPLPTTGVFLYDGSQERTSIII